MKIYVLLDMRDKAHKIIGVFSEKNKCLQERKAVASRFSVDEKFIAVESFEVNE